MIQAFYKTTPTQGTPYQQLSLMHGDGSSVRLSAGTKWGREYDKEVKNVPVKSFNEGKERFDEMSTELENQGWRAYNRYQEW
jgi:hypothetical protein